MSAPIRQFTSQQLLDVLSLSTNATAIYSSEDIVIETANNAMIAFWGKDRSVIGKTLAEAVPELEGQPFIGMLKNVYRTGITELGESVPAELLIDGRLQTFYYDFEYRAIKNEVGQTYCILHTAADVTEQILNRKALEEAQRHQHVLEQEQILNEELIAINEELYETNQELQITRDELNKTNSELEKRVLSRTQELTESEARFRFMLNAIPQQVWTAGADGALDYVNQVVCDDFGFNTAEIVGHGWQAFIHPDDLQGCLRNWVSALETGKEYMVEFRLKFHDGIYRWHLARALPLIEDGRIKMWLGTNTNIEFQKEKEQQKDEFLSIASHELKTPLTSIKAYNQLMLRMGAEGKILELGKKSAAHIMRLEKLIGDLLDVTKINAGKMNYTMEPFSFSQMLKDSVDSSRHMSPTHEIILEDTVDIDYNGDRFRLEQVVHNFISNAVKYSPNGKTVVVNNVVNGDNIIVSVRDFGIGIAQENLDRLFERYYRVDNTAMRFDGLGLGLFISSEILKRHNGSFWVESEQGQGSTFYFQLPLASSPDAGTIIQTDTYYHDKSITITYHPDHRRINVDWTGFQNMESVQKGCMIMLDILIKNHCYRVVNDNSNVQGNWSEAVEWVGNVWFPMMERAGMKYFAHIFSPSTFSQLAAKKSIDIMAGIITTQYFTDVTLAEEWVDSK